MATRTVSGDLARVSVVVPIYNVAAYLEPCLESVAQQTVRDLDVVMVDDGSTDESADIAERFAARDPRFRLVRQANAGLGAARNTGADHARGEFMAFLDSDDVVPRHAYEVLLGALDRTGSDFASGNVRRLTPSGTSPAAYLGKACERTLLRTHITRFPPLVLDRTAWNKLFRRSFWDTHAFRFPEGALYEDIPVILPAHYLAESVDVVAETVYLWRLREGADLSITQRRTDPKALRDRVAAVSHVSGFLRERGLRVSKAFYDRSVVGADLRFFLEVLPDASEEYRRLFLELVNDFLDGADPWALEQRSALNRLKWHLVRKRALPELLEVLRFEDEEIGEVPPVRRGRRWYGDYPYRTDDKLRIPARVYRLEEELAPVVRIGDLRWEGQQLRIEGFAYIDMIGAPAADAQKVELVVRRVGSRFGRFTLRATSVHRPDVTASAAQQRADLDWSGFEATLDATRLRRRGRWRDGTWEIGVVIRAGGVVRRIWRLDPEPLHATPLARLSAEGVHLTAGARPGDPLTVRVQSDPPTIGSCVLDDGVLQLEGSAGSVRGARSLRLSRAGGTSRLDLPVHIDRADRPPAFVARVPLAELLPGARDAEPELSAEEDAESGAWELALASGGRATPLTAGEGVTDTAFVLDGREVMLERNALGDCTLVERPFQPVITNIEWTPDGSLALSGSFRGLPGEYDLVLAARGRDDEHVTALRYDREREEFATELTPAAVLSLAGTHPLSEGLWDLLVQRRGGGSDSALSLVVDHELLGDLPLSRQLGRKWFHLGVGRQEIPVLAVERDLEDGERGGFRQRMLRTSFFASQRRAELRDVVLYDSFGGRGYSDSPRAVHEELVRRGAPFRHMWVVRDEAFDVPATAQPLREHSRDYYEAYARSRYIVANDHWPRWFKRRPGQTCVQAWHGAPLKLHGHDLADRPRAVREYRRVLSQHADNWQFVVSPGSFATPILERAFPVGEEILETGLPRTDLVHRNGDHAAALVEQLGLGGKRVVLYAPTYRDDLDYGVGRRKVELRAVPSYGLGSGRRDGYRIGRLLDLAAVRAALGDEYVLLFRKHPQILDGLPPEGAASVLDVSHFPDATELLLVADVLVTDYSSLAFDFASTGRPIVFFTPDLEHYRDEVRGLNIDLEARAPGPVLRTTEEVIAALRDPDALHSMHRDRYDAFVASFCALADGHASDRVIDRVFQW
jgi:CDP-glycerol glycerophosphotransferase